MRENIFADTLLAAIAYSISIMTVDEFGHQLTSCSTPVLIEDPV